MEIILSHIYYIIAVFIFGLVAGWKTYPAYQRFTERVVSFIENRKRN